MAEIAEATVERTWQRCAGLSVDAARREMNRAARLQPDLLAFVRETTAELSPDAHELAIYVYFVVLQIFLAGTRGRIPRVRATQIIPQFEENEALFESLQGAHPRFLEQAARFQVSRQPFVVKYVVEAIMEAPDGDDPVPLTDEESGLLFLVLKTAIDVLDMDPKSP